jgi:tRNA threonylcarbamoyladenosine biosynthesis protein TsaB
MRILAIDTSLATGSVAALDGDRRAERPLAAGGHARDLAGELVAAAADLGWRIQDAAVIAVVKGPGSFTGLRVGVTTAKSLAWASGARLVAVSGFEVVARAAARLAGWPTDAAVHVAFDAGRGEVYAALVTPAETPTGWSVGPAALHTATAWLAGLPRDACVSGPALVLLAEPLAGLPGLRLPPPAAWQPSAGEAGDLAALLAAAGRGDDPQTLVPEYLRPNYADERAAGTIGPA